MPLPDEDAHAPPSGRGIACGRRGVSAGERVAELVERRLARAQALDEGGQGLAHVDEHALVVGLGRHRVTVCLRVEAGEAGVGADHRRHVLGARAHLARVEDRLNALRPEAVRASVPREPAVMRRVQDGGGIALERRQSLRSCAGRRSTRAAGIVTACARHRAADRQAPVEEEPLAERNGRGIARCAVALIACGRRRPGTVLQHAAELGRREGRRLR